MAQLCLNTYQDGIRPDDDFISVAWLQKKNAAAIAVEHREWRAIIFEGSDQGADFLDNFDIRKTPYYHSGFFTHYIKIYAKVESWLDTTICKYGDKPLYFAGHSLGGACAIIAALESHIEKNLTPEGVFVFGCPKTLTITGKKVFDRAGIFCRRFRNHQDIVPRVPRRSMGFYHAGEEYYIDRKGYFHKTSRWFWRFWDRCMGGFLYGAISDHSMGEYAELLDAWTKRVGK